MSRKKTIKFKGRVYQLFGQTGSKRSAIKMAKGARELGYKFARTVRVHETKKTPEHYLVYARKTK